MQDGDDLSETLSGTCAHDPCEYNEEVSKVNLLDSSRSMAGEVVTTSGVGLDDVSVSKLRQTCAQRRASVHEAPMRATSPLSTPIQRATIFLVEHEGVGFLSVGKTLPPRVSSDISGQV